MVRGSVFFVLAIASLVSVFMFLIAYLVTKQKPQSPKYDHTRLQKNALESITNRKPSPNTINPSIWEIEKTYPFPSTTDAWPIFITKATANKKLSENARSAVLYFGGGPGLSSQTPGVLKKLNTFYGQNDLDLFLVDYSGSVIGEDLLISRLEKQGMAALGKDAISASKFITELRNNGYSEIYIHSESFSSLLVLSLLKYRTCSISGVIFLAPWTHFYPSSFVYNRHGPHLQGDSQKRKRDYIDRNEKFLHIVEDKATDRGRAWMKEARSNVCALNNTYALFPEFESRMDLAVGIKFFERLGANTILVKTHYHETIDLSHSVKHNIQLMLANQDNAD